MEVPLWVGVAYVGTLALSETFALLCSCLVRRSGEVVPDWVPVPRGRRIRPAAVLAPATIAGLLLTALTVDWVLTTFSLAGLTDVPYDNGWWKALAVTVSACSPSGARWCWP
ncbi:hypothetical protein ACWCP6_27700 [Streptomyces sp. NPDC002004]